VSGTVPVLIPESDLSADTVSILGETWYARFSTVQSVPQNPAVCAATANIQAEKRSAF